MTDEKIKMIEQTLTQNHMNKLYEVYEIEPYKKLGARFGPVFDMKDFENNNLEFISENGLIKIIYNDKDLFNRFKKL